jgi:predicted CXXCH cytochrome family protein
VSEHRFELARSRETLCTFCHRPASVEAFVHEPFAEGDCGGCHLPHGGATRSLLVSEDEKVLCGKCHQADRPKKSDGQAEEHPPFAVLHQPVAEGKCSACHMSHQSKHAALMTRPERELCLSCHEETRASLAGAGHVHKPLETECRSCHVSHGASDRRFLRQEPRTLCLSCHEALASALAAGQAVHGALEVEGSCLNCHAPHAGATQALIASAVGPACLSCHDREIELPSQRKVADIKKEITGSQFHHGPVGIGDCLACHRSHTSPHASLLSGGYPREMYVEFSEDSYSGCLFCHDRRLITEARSTSTGFRDGDRNLHHVHVNRKKGRSCRVCHRAHAGDLPKLMRREVPFGSGGWLLPIGYEEAPEGGRCSSGCHRALGYVRGGGPARAPEGR